MTINFRYSANDFAEANKAKLAALSGKPVDPAAAKAKSRYGTGVMRWVLWGGMAVFLSYLESQNLLTLYTRDLGMQIVPRRAFAEPGSFERFCGLVQTHVAAGQFLPRQSGFAVIAPVPALPIESEMNPRERHAT